MAESTDDGPDGSDRETPDGVGGGKDLVVALGIAALVLLFNLVWNFTAAIVFEEWLRSCGSWVVFLAGVSYMPLLLRIVLKRPGTVAVKKGFILGCAGALLLNGFCWGILS